MNILVWNECYVAGGADWSLIDLIESWPEKSDTFTVCVNRSHEGLSLLKRKLQGKAKLSEFSSYIEMTDKLCKKLGINRGSILRKGILSLMLVKSFIEYYKYARNDYDVLIMNNGGYPGGLSNFLVAVIAKYRKINARYMIVRNYPVRHYQDDIMMKISKFMTNRYIDQVICVSNSLKNSIASMTGIYPARLKVIHNGISVLNKLSTEDETIQQNENSTNQFKVGIIGTIQERKGHDILFKAWEKVSMVVPTAKLHIVGSKESGDIKSLMSLAADLNITTSIHWVDFTENIGDIYKNLDAVVMPSKEFESFGRIVVETMAFKKPIIGSNVGGIPELISHGDDGLLFENGDSDTLAELLIELYNNPERRAAISEQGYKKYKSRFTSEIMANNYHELIVQK